MGESWEHVKELFHETRHLSADQRRERLAEVGSGVRREVEQLIEAHRDEPVAPATEGPGEMVGRYKLLQKLGEGGFGIVYMAEQLEPVQRKVAVKIIKPGMDSKPIVARFEVERQALALMDHPNISQVFDGGVTRNGRPYFVMELVKGVPITEYCDQASLGTEDRLALFRTVCGAVQHAHQKGVIHRDLKPSNILVTLHDGKPVPKVIDFGVAKATGQRLTDKTVFTEFQQMIGTPEYMAPEQAEMSGLDIDTRADVYSLGVLLYELLTGSKPFELKTLLQAGYDEMMRHIREVDPPKPSTRISTLDDLPTIAKRRRSRPKLLGKLLRGDLDWIVMKALEKDRTRRYETASAFAMDIGRYLDDEEVVASPPSAIYRLRKFVRRHRVGVAAGVVVAAGLLGGLALALVGFLEARDERDRATTQATRANTVTSLIEAMFESWDPASAKGANFTARELLDDFDLRFRDSVGGEPEVEAQVRRIIGRSYRELGIPDKAEPHIKAAHELGIRVYGEDHSFVADNRLTWAWLLADRGRYRDAADGFRAIARNRNNAAAMRASAYRGLADTLAQLTRYAEAEPAARQAITLAPDEEARDDGKQALARVLDARGRRREAERVLREVLASRRTRYGENHPRLAVTLNQLGMTLMGRTELEEAESMYRRALSIWEHAYGRPDEFVLRNLATVREMLGHQEEAEQLAAQAVALARKRLGPRHRDTAAALVCLGDMRRLRSNFHGAAKLYEEARAILRATIGTNNVDYANVVRALAQVRARLGEYEASLALNREAVELNERFYGEKHGSSASVHHNLAATLYEVCRFDDALVHARHAIAIHEELGLEDELSLATKLNMLGIILSELGQYDECEAALKRSLAIRQKHLAHPHEYVATSYNNLAHLHHNRGDLKQAERDYRKALAILKEIHGEDHLDAASSLANLGIVMEDKEDFPAAVGYLERSLAVRRGHLGPDHHDVALVLFHLARAYGRMGHLERALACNTDALRIREAKLGHDHVETLRAYASRGVLYFSAMRFAEAAPPLRTAVRGYAGQDSHPATVARFYLGLTLLCIGESDEAETLVKRAVAAASDRARAAHLLERIAFVLTTGARADEAAYAAGIGLEIARAAGDRGGEASLVFRLGSIQAAQERWDAAEATLHKALAMRRRLDGEENREFAAILATLASVHQSRGQLPEAERLLTRSIAITRRVDGDDHVDLALLINNLGTIRQDRGDLEGAERHFRDALARTRGIFGADSFRTAVFLSNIGGVMARRGKSDEAARLYGESLALHRKELGANDLRTLNTLVEYGNALAAGKRDGAIAVLEEALRGYEAQLEGNAPQILYARMYLSWAYNNTGGPHEKLEALCRANLRDVAPHGTENQIWVEAAMGLASALKKKGMVAEEIELRRKLLPVARKVYADDPLYVARMCMRLADPLEKRGDYVEAEQLAREAMTLRDKALPKGHWHHYSCRCLIGRCLAGQKKFEEAEKILLENYPKMNPPPGALGFKQEAREGIAQMYEDWGKPEKAAEWRK